MGHISVFPRATVANLDKLWLSRIAIIPHRNCRPRMIYDFTWSSVTATTDRLAPEEAMLLGNTLKRTIRHVLKADPTLGPIYLSKVYLADVYMRLWVRMEDIPSLVFLIPEKHPSNPHLIGFHLSLPMG